MKIQLKRSNVLDGGAAKEPTASQMEYGELAVNYNTDDPAIFLKDSNNNIIRISGVNNIADDGQVEVPSSIAPPSDPLPGNLWFNPVDGRLYVYYDDGNSQQWVDASPDSWNPSVIPDPDGGDNQPGTLDDRYVKKIGDNMTGDLTLGTDKITLNTDGVGTFNQAVNTPRLTVGDLTDATYVVNLHRAAGGNDFELAGKVLKLSTGGAGYPSVSTKLAFSASGITSDAYIGLGGDYTDFALCTNTSFRIGGTLPSAPNITLAADGWASFNLTESRTYDPTGVTFGAHAVNVIDTSDSGWAGFRLIADSSNAVNTSASIQAVQNFNNRADFTIATYGASGSLERLRINDSGNVLIGGTLPSAPNISLNANGKAEFANAITFAAGSTYESTFSWTDAAGSSILWLNPHARKITIHSTATQTVGVFLEPSHNNWSSLSQRSLKTNLTPITDGLNKVSTLSAVIGTYKVDEEGVPHPFLIADEVKEVLPEAVGGEGSEQDPLSLRYTEVIPLLVSALQDAKDRIENLEATNASLEARLTALEGAN